MPEPTYRLITDEAEASAGFEEWRSALRENAAEDRNVSRVEGQGFVFDEFDQITKGSTDRIVRLGFDASGANWIVQINERKPAGKANSQSGIVKDAAGQRFLVRQGHLRPNALNKEGVKQEQFAARTGLKKITVSNGDMPKVKRDWYIVSRLGDHPSAIRSNTGIFVALCALARGDIAKPTPAETDVLKQLYAAPETGGEYWQGAKGAQPAKLVVKVQGNVSEALHALVCANGGQLRKPCVAGYEVDAQIINQQRKLLVEIKTTTVASDIHAGVGQLMLYRKLMPLLADHTMVLLLPEPPKSIVKKAIEDCGICVCTFVYNNSGTTPVISFSPQVPRTLRPDRLMDEAWIGCIAQAIEPIGIGLRPQDRFPNPRGYALAVDKLFCCFRIEAPRASGVYGWFVDDELVYIGRAANLRNRLSDQYGRVSPRHPYAGGQLQKCRINARINEALAAGSTVTVKWLATPDYVAVERELLAAHRPSWNSRWA